MMVDTQDTRIMNKEKDDKKILEAICSFYKFHVHFGYKIRLNHRYSVGAYRKNESYYAFDSIHDIVDTILNWADSFGIPGDGIIRYMKNIFYGCKTLEDVLIARDLHSDEDLEL